MHEYIFKNLCKLVKFNMMQFFFQLTKYFTLCEVDMIIKINMTKPF